MTNYTRRALGNPSSDAVSITAISTTFSLLSSNVQKALFMPKTAKIKYFHGMMYSLKKLDDENVYRYLNVNLQKSLCKSV